MYRILPKKLLFSLFAWLVIALILLGQYLSTVSAVVLKYSSIPALAWIALSAMLWNPVWRLLWRKIPSLNQIIFPDLNGRWKMELSSNWPRQEQLLNAAMSQHDAIDMRSCPDRKSTRLNSSH